MNLAQTKVALENSVGENIKKNLTEGAEVKTLYDINKGCMLVEIVQHNDRKENENTSNIMCYNFQYNEEAKELLTVAFNRAYIYDAIGIAVVNNEAITLSESFIAAIKKLIVDGMDEVYNPKTEAKGSDNIAE